MGEQRGGSIECLPWSPVSLDLQSMATLCQSAQDIPKSSATVPLLTTIIKSSSLLGRYLLSSPRVLGVLGLIGCTLGWPNSSGQHSWGIRRHIVPCSFLFRVP